MRPADAAKRVLAALVRYLNLNRITPRGQRGDVQGLRAVAVLLVVLDHAGVSFLKGGYIGVDVFFVLSGFLITGLLKSGAGRGGYGSLADFYSRRARRILPAAALTLVVTDIVALALLNFVRAKQVLHDSIPSALFIANFHFAAQGTNYFFQGQPPSPFQHFWSLAVEEQFYVVWPLLLLVALLGFSFRRRAVRARRPAAQRQEIARAGLLRLDCAIGVIIAASLAWSIYYTKTHQTAAYFSTFTRAWELGLGAALALSADRVSRLPSWLRAGIGWLGLVAIGVAAVSFSANTPFPGYEALLPTLGAVGVVAAGLGEQSRLSAGRALAIRPMRYVGDRSYTFYLWHWPALILAEQYEGHALALSTNLLLLCGAFGLSMVSYSLFENPIRRLRWSSPSRALILWPVSVVAVLIVAGIGIGSADETGTRLASMGSPMYPGYTAAGVYTSQASPAASQGQVVSGPSNGPLPQVLAAVHQVEANDPIPQDVSPALGSLLNSEYEYPAGCGAHDGQSSSNICDLGSPKAGRSIVLMGDSHAQMWMPALLSFAQSEGYAVRPIGKSGCTPADWWHVDNPAPDCQAWYAWAVRQIRALRPSVILIAGSFEGLAGDADAAAAGITRLVESVRRYSQHTLVLADQPPQVQQPVDCLLSSNPTMGKCSLRPTAPEIDLTNQMASATASAGATFVPTVQWFCSQDICPMVVGHTVVYADPGHITAQYAAELDRPFRAAIDRAIRAKA